MGDLTWTCFGAELTLCPERAAYRPDRRELLIADVHLGKAATFRRAGRPLPRGTTAAELARIDALVERLGAERLTILGDLFHAEVEPGGPTARAFGAWLEARDGLEVTLVRGNHDRHARSLIDELPLRAVAEPHPAAPFSYVHHPGPSPLPFIAGHIHPGGRLDDGTDRMKLPVFWERPDGLVLPAFGSFTGLHVVQPSPTDRIAAATPRAVTEVPLALLREV